MRFSDSSLTKKWNVIFSTYFSRRLFEGYYSLKITQRYARAEVQLASTFDRGARAWNADVVYK